jgi:hypothetical protein
MEEIEGPDREGDVEESYRLFAEIIGRMGYE